MSGDSSSIVGKERSAELGVIALNQQIEDHKKADGDRSILASGLSQVWRSDESSLERLQKLQQEVEDARLKGDSARIQRLQPEISTALEADQKEIEFQNDFSHYVGGGVKTASLFFGGSKAGFLANRGGYGLAATVTLYGLDQAHAKDDAWTIAGDFTLGGLKGGLTKGMFHGLGKMHLEAPALKGIVLGAASRGIDSSLTPATYIDTDGQRNIAQGLRRTWDTVTDTRAMVIDATLFAGAHGLTRGANLISRGAVDASPLANTVITSGSFGLSGGGYHEFDRQIKAGEEIDYIKVFNRALLQGGIDAIAGLPGGLNADVNFRNSVRDKLTNFRTGREGYSNAADAIIKGAEPTGRTETFEAAVGDALSVRPATDGRGTGRAPALLVEPVSTRPSAEGLGTPVESALVPELLKVSPATDGRGTGRKPSLLVEPLVEAKEKPPGLPEEIKPELAVPREFPPGDVARAKVAVDDMVSKLTGAEPTPVQVAEICDYLANHPEADGHAADLYVQHFANPVVRRAIESFYKPAFSMSNECHLAKPTVRDAYEKFQGAIGDVANGGILPSIWARRINNLITNAKADGPALRELIEHHGRTTHSAVAAKAIDAAFGTKYTEALSAPRPNRMLPLTEADLAYLKAVAVGKHPDVPAVPATSADGKPRTAIDIAAGVEKSGLLRPGLQAACELGMGEQINKTAEEMRTASGTQRLDAATKLAQQLHHESAADWFADWLKVAPETHLTGVQKLELPAVKAITELAPDAVRKFLGARSHVGLDYRFTALENIATTFEKNPQVAVELIKIAGENPAAMKQMGIELTTGFSAKSYKAWLESLLTPGADGTQPPRPTVDQISGDAALRKARIFGAFSGEPELAAHLEKFAEAFPEVAKELLKKLPQPTQPAQPGADGREPRGPNKGQEAMQALLKERLQRRVSEGTAPDAKPEELNPDMLNLEIRLSNSFKSNPDAMAVLVEFARNNLTAVDKLLKMPGMVEPQNQRGPKKPFDRNDPQLKLSRAYVDVIGVLAPQAALLGPAEGLAVMQKVQAQFADTIAKYKASAARPLDVSLMQAAGQAEVELNKLTNPLLPKDKAVVDDARDRREAVAKQDANLVPRRQPPGFTGADTEVGVEGFEADRESRLARQFETSDVSWKDAPESQGSDADFANIESRMSGQRFRLSDNYTDVLVEGERVALGENREFRAFASAASCESFARFCSGYLDSLYPQGNRHVATVSVMVEGRQRYLPVVTVTLPNGSDVTGIYTMDNLNRPVCLSRIPNGEIAQNPAAPTQGSGTKPEAQLGGALTSGEKPSTTPEIRQPETQAQPAPIEVRQQEIPVEPTTTVTKPEPTRTEAKPEPPITGTNPQPPVTETKPQPTPPNPGPDATELERLSKPAPTETDGDGVDMRVGPTETRELLARLSTSRVPGTVVNQGAIEPEVVAKAQVQGGTPSTVVPSGKTVESTTPPAEKVVKKTAPPTGQKKQPPVISDQQAHLNLMAAEEQARQQDWKQRRGKDKGDDSNGGGKGRNKGRRSWRDGDEDGEY